jgi:HPt (histidine-containing phosphotransfer) domain-containing protein
MAAIDLNHRTIECNGIIVDLNMLFDVCDNDLQSILKILHTFLNNMPGTLERIEVAIEKENWEEVYQASHYAKSSLAVVKVGNMWHLAFSIEKSAKTRSGLSAIKGSLEEMKNQFFGARLCISEIFGENYNSAS